MKKVVVLVYSHQWSPCIISGSCAVICTLFGASWLIFLCRGLCSLIHICQHGRVVPTNLFSIDIVLLQHRASGLQPSSLLTSDIFNDFAHVVFTCYLPLRLPILSQFESYFFIPSGIDPAFWALSTPSTFGAIIISYFTVYGSSTLAHRIKLFRALYQFHVPCDTIVAIVMHFHFHFMQHGN
jgi:hypothetical protein